MLKSLSRPIVSTSRLCAHVVQRQGHAPCSPHLAYNVLGFSARRAASKKSTAKAAAEKVVEDDPVDHDISPLQRSEVLEGRDTRPELVVRRPPMSTFRKPGFPKDLLRWLSDFPQALLLVRVGQFYEVRIVQLHSLSPCSLERNTNIHTVLL